jgi:hypothetical protein
MPTDSRPDRGRIDAALDEHDVFGRPGDDAGV